MRETGYALLMDALAAQGNVAEAMRVYDHARTTLDQELGITLATRSNKHMPVCLALRDVPTIAA
jgi:pentatricopeptide repeat protein